MIRVAVALVAAIRARLQRGPKGRTMSRETIFNRRGPKCRGVGVDGTLTGEALHSCKAMRVIDWLNENSGAVMAIVTAVCAVFTILLWWATRRQAALTRQIF